MIINWRLIVLPKVSYSTRAVMSLIHQTIFILWLHFRTGVVLGLGHFWQTLVSFNVLYSSVAVTKFWLASRPILTGRFLSLRVWTAWWWIINVVICFYSIARILRGECGTVLMLPGGVGLASPNVTIDAMIMFEDSHLCESLSAAALVSRKSAISASNISPMTSLSNRSFITCSTTLYMADRMPLCALGATCLVWGSATSIKVNYSLTTKSLTADFTFLAITYSSLARGFSAGRF